MKKIRTIFAVMIVLLMTVLLSVSVSATYYEPDGTSSVEYEFPAADCDRTLYVNCIDYDTGATIKKMTYHTKKSEDELISLSIYGYDITDFTSESGLFNTCKITWTSGTGLCSSAYIQIRYKFAALGAKTMTATVTLRKSEAITLEVRHYVQKRDATNLNYKYYSLYSSSSQVVDYYTYVSTSSKSITGYHLKDGYQSSISGKLTYSKEIDSGLASLQHEVGGDIQAVYPFEDEVAIICADEGKILGYDLNRALYDKGEIYDILAGTFLVTDCSGENFAGLSDEMLAKYEKAFHTPQSFVKLNGKIFAVPEKPKPDRSSPSREER